MNYKPNEINWKVGDIVIHDADAKKEEMLMKVIRIIKTLKKTIYETKLFNYPNKKFMNSKENRYLNKKECLHDPKRFGIDISKFNASHFPSNKLFQNLSKIHIYKRIQMYKKQHQLEEFMEDLKNVFDVYLENTDIPLTDLIRSADLVIQRYKDDGIP